MTLWIIILFASVISFAISAYSGRLLIPFLHKLKFGQPIKVKDGPEWHAKKQGTPTMGGFMFIISTTITSILAVVMYRLWDGQDFADSASNGRFYMIISVVVFCLLFAFIGFIDDYTKVVRKNNDGLTAIQKIILQTIFSVGFLFCLHIFGDGSTSINLGFWETPDLGIFYYILMFLVIIYLTNAVNLTDGVDGLCGSVTFTAMLIYTICCSILVQTELSCFTMALAGGCLGFLVWNLNPAKCFMGDTGSMFLGAAVTVVGLVLHNHLLMLLVCLVYIIEALSVMIQVTYFKITKKKYGEGRRIFKMTPIHHHFEMSNWSEYKIVISFSLACVFFGGLGIALILTF